MGRLKHCSRCKKDVSEDLFGRSSRRNAKGERPLRSWCNPCRARAQELRLERKKHQCIDCGELCHHNSKRCRTCSQIARRGENHHNWKGGRTKSRGYIYLSGHQDHPNSNAGGQIPEHVLVMSEHIGRALLPGESVHHINGVRDDNRIENLELWASTQPSGQRVKDLLTWAREIIETYEHIVD